VIVFIQIETVSESQHKLIPETKIIPKWIRWQFNLNERTRKIVRNLFVWWIDE
jgi:hypothetical protein